jgi:hypothetical protein
MNIKSQAGSALFIILIAVMIFAALSYTVAQMLRGGSPSMITEEKSRLFAGEILNAARGMRQAVQNIKISNGCADMDISFENPIIAGYTHIPVAPVKCRIFDGSGGGLNYAAPSDEWLDMALAGPPALRGQWYFPADICVPGTGSAPTGCNSDNVDNEALIVIMPYVRKEVCIWINKALGITNPGGSPPTESDNAWTASADKFNGAQSDGEKIDMDAQAGCFEGAAGSTPPSGTYHFYQIIVPR